MKHLLLAATVMITLTACENNIVKPQSFPSRVHWYLIVGMTSGEVLCPQDGGNIGQTLEAELIEQEHFPRFENALALAEDIIDERPDLIDISISWISVQGSSYGRSIVTIDGCGEYMGVLMSAIESSEITYAIKGETLSCEEVFSVTTSKGEEVLITVRVMSYYLWLIRPAAE